NAARAGAAAVVLYGAQIPPGGLGLDESVPVPVVAVPADVARTALQALARGEQPALSLGSAAAVRNGTSGKVAPFSSQGLSFDWRVRPDVLGPGVALMTSEPSVAEDGSSAYGTVTGSSAAAATVAGGAALLAQARPDLGANALRSLLAGYGRPLAERSSSARARRPACASRGRSRSAATRRRSCAASSCRRSASSRPTPHRRCCRSRPAASASARPAPRSGPWAGSTCSSRAPTARH